MVYVDIIDLKTTHFMYPCRYDALALLICSRAIGAIFSIIHDCDETYNYWEPLHYFLYGYGFQTWEYSAAFALRSWWYILLHGLFGAPLVVVLGPSKGKILVWYGIKLGLSTLSGLSEWYLYRCVRVRYSERTSRIFLLLLCCSSGMFAAAPAFLPSSFTMVAMTMAAAGFLGNRPALVIASSVFGTIWGWIVAAPAFLSYALWVLFGVKPIARSFGILGLSALVAVSPTILIDKIFYGTWKASLWNFVLYNVVGGGHSELYGIEGPFYYFKNGFNQLQLVLPLALLMPILSFIYSTAIKFNHQKQSNKGKDVFAPRQENGNKSPDARLLLCISPCFVWLGAISMLPHKEERFLYVVYPLLCLGSAAALDLVFMLFSNLFGSRVSRLGLTVSVSLMVMLSLSRSFALYRNYSAPMYVYQKLPNEVQETQLSGKEKENDLVNVCVGAEWYRFPSSFFLPGPHYRLRFLKSGFDGLLPRAFNTDEGGSRAAPLELNQWNREEPSNYWNTTEHCQYMVTVGASSSFDWIDVNFPEDSTAWEIVAEKQFLNAAESPALSRAFYIPYISNKQNRWYTYALLRQRGK